MPHNTSLDSFDQDDEIMNMLRNDILRKENNDSKQVLTPLEPSLSQPISAASTVNASSSNVTSSLVSMIVRIQMPLETSEESIKTFFNGIGSEMTKRHSFRSRKVIASPKAETHRVFVILIKFSNWDELCKWEDSQDLQRWISFGESLEFDFQRTMIKSPVLRVNLSILADKYNPVESSVTNTSKLTSLSASGSPPKWKMWLVIWFFVFLCVTTSAYAGTLMKVNDAIGGDYAFALLMSLSTVVPLMSYCLLPMVMSVPQVKRWLIQRPYSPTTDNMFIRLLDKGLTIFRQPDNTIPADITKKMNEMEHRIGIMKKRIDELEDRDISNQFSALESGTIGEEQIFAKHSVQLKSEKKDGTKDRQVHVDKSTGEVTVTVNHNIRWEYSHDFEQWNLAMGKAMHEFSDSFHGVDVFNRSYSLGLSQIDLSSIARDVERGNIKVKSTMTTEAESPRLPVFDSKYVVLFRYGNRETMERWLRSTARAKMLKQAQYMFYGEHKYRHVDNQVPLGENGDSGSLVSAGDILGDLLLGDSTDNSSKPPPPPPVYRTTLLTLLGLFIIAWPVNYRLIPALIRGGVTATPLIVLCSTCVTVFGNVYITAPLVFFFFASWLQCPPPDSHGFFIHLFTYGLPNNKIRAFIAITWFLAHWLSVFL